MLIFIFLLCVWLICVFSRTLPPFCVVKVSGSPFHLSISWWARAARHEAICLTISASLTPSRWWLSLLKGHTSTQPHLICCRSFFPPLHSILPCHHSTASSLSLCVSTSAAASHSRWEQSRVPTVPLLSPRPGMAYASWLWRCHFVCPPVAIGLEGNLACWFWSEEWSVHLWRAICFVCSPWHSEEWDGWCT